MTLPSIIRTEAAQHRGRRSAWPLAVIVAALLTSVTPTASATPQYAGPNDASVVNTWNQLAVSALVADTTKPGPQGFLYIGFVQAAVYDAVVGVHRDYAPLFAQPKPHRPASAAAAAVGAAYGVLSAYFPSAKTALDTQYAASVSRMRPDAGTANGLAYGADVARRLVERRAHDGRDAVTAPLPAPAPGVWRPTPPGFAPMASPWLGAVTPLVLASGAQFDPGPPPAMTSAQYTADYNEVKALGASVGSTRTAPQTATALFYSGNAIVQFDAAARDQVTSRDLDLVAAARLLAAVAVGQADTAIAVWNAKYKYPFWRPLTAITLGDTDGNPATAGDPAWTPLVANPNYPDWVSGYSAQSAVFAGVLRAIVGDSIDARLISTAAPGVTRTYPTGDSLVADVVNGRMWLGVHFRSADTYGAALGGHVADYVMAQRFGATEDEED